MTKCDYEVLSDVAKKLRSETSIVRSMIQDVTSRYALRDTIPVMEKAASILEKLADTGSIQERVKIITALSDSMEGQINAFIKDSVASKEDFEILDIQINETGYGHIRALICYQYRESTRS